MKKLTKLNINPDKVMKNEELLMMRGGYGENSCCVCLNKSGTVMGYMGGSNQTECETACSICHWEGSYGPWTYC